MKHLIWALLLVLLFVVAGCSGPGRPSAASGTDAAGTPAIREDALPDLAPVDLGDGEILQIVATTSIVADVVRQVGGDQVEVTTLLPLGADPHAYTAAPQDLRTLNAADVIFVNGLGLEEALQPVLTALDSDAPIIAVNAGIEPIAFGGEHEEEGHEEEGGDDHAHAGADPHTWFDVANVIVWTENIRQVLSALDPDHAEIYAAGAEAYAATLADLDQEIRDAVAALPPDRRKLVTDHDELAYFAEAYGFEVVGAVIPAISTMAEPSAQELAALQDQIRAEGLPAIFVGTTVNPDLERQIAQDLGIDLVTLYTASLSEADGPAPTYVDLMRYTVQAIVEALSP